MFDRFFVFRLIFPILIFDNNYQELFALDFLIGYDEIPRHREIDCHFKKLNDERMKIGTREIMMQVLEYNCNYKIII